MEGPHPVFTEIDCERNKNCQYVYFASQIQNLMHYEDSKLNNLPYFDIVDEYSTYYSSYPEELKHFDKAENAASEISYRCISCRKCQKCKQGEHIQYTSIKEEVVKDVINQSVTIDFESGKAEAKLPFMENPNTKLIPNKRRTTVSER